MPRWIVLFSSKMKMKEKDEDEDSSWQGTRLFLLSLVRCVSFVARWNWALGIIGSL
jgi:hypothetical protein